MARYAIGADGRPDRIEETATGVFTDPALLPVVFPGLMDAVEPHLVPDPDDVRVIEIDYCRNASAIYHLEPVDDIVVREWSPEGRLAAVTLIVGRFAKGAFTQKTAEIRCFAISRRPSWSAPAQCPTRTSIARSAPPSTVFQSANCSTHQPRA